MFKVLPSVLSQMLSAGQTRGGGRGEGHTAAEGGSLPAGDLVEETDPGDGAVGAVGAGHRHGDAVLAHGHGGGGPVDVAVGACRADTIDLGRSQGDRD